MPNPDKLTRRQLDVLTAITQGHTTSQQIGLHLGCGPKTVQNHLEAIYRKLGVQNRTEAIITAHRAGIIRI